MLSPRYPRLRDRLRRFELTLSIPCRHGWEYAHCTHDDEGSHVSEGGDGILRSSDGTTALLPTDFCYCGEAVRIDARLELVILADRLSRWWIKHRPERTDEEDDELERARETRQR